MLIPSSNSGRFHLLILFSRLFQRSSLFSLLLLLQELSLLSSMHLFQEETLQIVLLPHQSVLILLDSKCHGGNVATKMDITKAFDMLSWDFLLHVLEVFGFHLLFVSWVRALLYSAKLSL